MLRFSVLKSAWRARSLGFTGNMEGDGTLLGSTLVVGPRDQGILFEYHSKEFGDHAEVADVLEAVKKISDSKKTESE